MKRIVLLCLIGMSIIPLSAQTLKKQNQMLKDSIGVMQKVIDEKTTANQTLSQENSTLKSKHALLLASKDSLDEAQKTLLDKYKGLSIENDQLKDSQQIFLCRLRYDLARPRQRPTEIEQQFCGFHRTG